MAKLHVMTAKRKAALRKAQKASARNRRRRGFVKSEVIHFASKRGQGKRAKSAFRTASGAGNLVRGLRGLFGKKRKRK